MNYGFILYYRRNFEFNYTIGDALNNECEINIFRFLKRSESILYLSCDFKLGQV